MMGGGVRQMLMLADKGGGGVENRQNSADIVYGRPLSAKVQIKPALKSIPRPIP